MDLLGGGTASVLAGVFGSACIAIVTWAGIRIMNTDTTVITAIIGTGVAIVASLGRSSLAAS